MNRFRNPKTQSGQVAILLVISLMTMVLTVSLVFNTGQQLHWKTNVQNAVDSAVVSHGSNVARSLNVMSANNVAITQAFTLNILMASLVPELTAATYEVTAAMPVYIKAMTRYCNNWWTAFLCADATIALAQAGFILADLEDIWDQIGSFMNPSKVNDARRMVEALESMNSQLYYNFGNQSANMSEKLAYMNGLDEMPVYIGGIAFYANKESDLRSNYNGTWLPVEKTVTLQSGVAPVLSGIDEAVQNLQLCITGYEATPMRLPKAFWNLQEHGYDFGEGPYEIGKERFNRVIEKQVRRIERLPKRIPRFFSGKLDVEDSTDFEDIVEVAYPLACSLQQTLQTVAFVPLPSVSITMYKASEPVLLANSRANPDWTILGVARKEQSTGFAGKDIFVNPIGAHYAYAQVEVFNPIWYDLYTQDWTVKLQPADHLANLSQDFVDAIAAQFPEIEPALREGEPKFNTH